ncbi:MAG: HesA/MoeB/ThiF family protein [Actinobacteria bacterium]|nr:HesA/MoeB/ThiF family protein [Actinomycetota bacterium]
MSDESAAGSGRYESQTANPRWGEDEQRALAGATVFVVGAGALGSIAASYLAGAGVGRLAIVDGSTVDESDLHRQVLYLSPEAGMLKAESLAAKLSLVNPDVHVDPFPADLTVDNVGPILTGADFVLDCSSSDAVRRVVNDGCTGAGTAFCTAAVSGFDAALLAVVPGSTACCRCENVPNGLGLPSREDQGVFGPPAGAAASMQALTAIGFVTGAIDVRPGRLLRLRGGEMEWNEEQLQRTPGCICASDSRGGNV